MDERVRVLCPNGYEVTLRREFAESEGLKILDSRPAVDAFGRDIPPKHHITKRDGGAHPVGDNTKEEK